MKSVLIIGMGNFGRNLAVKMQEFGNEVMIVDKNEAIINEYSPRFTNAFIGNCTNLDVLRSLGVNNFDICFVCIGEDFQASLETTSLLKDLGARYVISKANRDIQAKFLARNGADEVIYPERDIAIKLAIRCNSNNIFDYIEITSEYGIFEVAINKSWINHSLRDLNIRNKFNINVLAVKHGTALKPTPSPEYVFQKDDHVVIIGKPDDVFYLTSQN